MSIFFEKAYSLQEAALWEIFSRGGPILGNLYNHRITLSQLANLFATFPCRIFFGF